MHFMHFFCIIISEVINMNLPDMKEAKTRGKSTVKYTEYNSDVKSIGINIREKSIHICKRKIRLNAIF